MKTLFINYKDAGVERRVIIRVTNASYSEVTEIIVSFVALFGNCDFTIE